jgi:hypothetical protein
LNLDDQPDRREFIEAQFKYWEIADYTRIPAYDGRKSDLSELLTGSYPEKMTSCEVGCTISHLKAIKHWLASSNSPYAVIMEDDCSLEMAKFWNFCWNDFYAQLPYDWDVVQMVIICTGDIHVKLHKRFVNDFSSACYLINRHHAEKLIRFHVDGSKYKLDNGVKPRAVADDLIYNMGNTFSIPLLIPNIDLGSSIHPDHIDRLHRGNHATIYAFWEKYGGIIDIKEYMDYDPYLGRVVKNSAVKS